jgi:hypothetical protein
MSLRVVYELPPFDTGEYERCDLHMTGGGATLTIHVSDLPPVILRFLGVRWHRFTALHNCESHWIRQAYFRLVEVPPSESLIAFLEGDSASRKAYSELHHFRIFLDETGCHEVYAESAHPESS